MNCAEIWGKKGPGQGNCRCKGPDMRMCLVCLRISRKETPARLEQNKEDSRK